MGRITGLLDKNRQKKRASTGVVHARLKTKKDAAKDERLQPYYGRGQGRNLGKPTTLNSPSLAYKAVYGTEPKTFLRGRTQHPQKMWNGIPVDETLKDEWLEDLNNLKGVEIRGSCAGHDHDRVSYVTFRLEKKRDKDAQKIAQRLNKKKGVYAIADIGREGRPRIVVATKKRTGQKEWGLWWKKLPTLIESEVQKKP